MPSELDPRAERASFSLTREHVGAAGFSQLNTLEQIINAGREQLIVTQALRQVVASTLEQQRATPLAQIGSLAPVHQAALNDIVTSGRAQIEIAHQLRLTIQRALAEVRETPLEHVSGHLLTTLRASVQQQAQDLDDIIHAAVGQAKSLDQIAQLEQVGAQAATQLRQTEHDRGERELVHLEQQATETLNQIRRLEQAGHTHLAQKTQLMAQAHTAAQRVAVLEQANAEDQLEITRLEGQRDEATEQRQVLETAANQTQQHLQDLKDQAKVSHAGSKPDEQSIERSIEQRR